MTGRPVIFRPIRPDGNGGYAITDETDGTFRAFGTEAMSLKNGDILPVTVAIVEDAEGRLAPCRLEDLRFTDVHTKKENLP